MDQSSAHQPKKAGRPRKNDPVKINGHGAHDGDIKVSINADVLQWLHISDAVFCYAVAHNNRELQKSCNVFRDNIGQICVILHAFKNSPGMRIAGDGGVRQQLKISHNAVYLWIDLVGLTAEDFRKPAVALAELVLKSSVTGPQLDEILKIWENYCQPAAKDWTDLQAAMRELSKQLRLLTEWEEDDALRTKPGERDKKDVERAQSEFRDELGYDEIADSPIKEPILNERLKGYLQICQKHLLSSK